MDAILAATDVCSIVLTAAAGRGWRGNILQLRAFGTDSTAVVLSCVRGCILLLTFVPQRPRKAFFWLVMVVIFGCLGGVTVEYGISDNKERCCGSNGIWIIVLSWVFTLAFGGRLGSSPRLQTSLDSSLKISKDMYDQHDGPTVAYVALESGETTSDQTNGDAATKKSDGPSIGRLVALSRPEWPAMSVATLALIVSTLAGLATPTYFGRMIDTISKSSDDDDKDDDDDGHALSRLNKITVELLCIFAIGSIFTFFRGAIFNTAGERVVARVRRRLFSAILAQGKSELDSQPSLLDVITQ